MNILFIGDIFGKPGMKAVLKGLPIIAEEYDPELIVANAENVAGGFGITRNLCTKLFRYGVDVLTSGNHVWDRDEAEEYLLSEPKLLRPINYPDGTPGNGSIIIEGRNGVKVGVINSQGRVFMEAIDDPFRTTLAEVGRFDGKAQVIIVDFHAEATSEKVAMGKFLDGKVNAVLGTHTHIQTADDRILPGGTAAITDAGMTGPHDSIIGVKTPLALKHLLTGRKVRFSPAKDDLRLQGTIIEIDDMTLKTKGIVRLDLEIEND